MSIFFNLKIGTKIAVGFIFVAILTGIVSVIGIKYILSIDTDEAVTAILITIGAGMCLSVLFGFSLGRLIAKPLQQIAEAAKKLGAGDHDFEIELKGADHKDEFGDLINAFIRLKDRVYWYEAILDSIPFPLSITDMNMNWAFINKEVENIIGKKRNEVVGKHCSNRGAEICKTEMCGIKRLRNNIPQTTFNQNGMSFQVNASYILGKNGEKIGHMEFVQDITAKSRVTDYQKSEVERLANNLKLISMGNFELDTNIGAGDEYTVSERNNFLEINKNVLLVKSAIINLISDIDGLVKAALEGKLNTRADVTLHSGEFKKIIIGVNETLDAVIHPVNEASAVLQEIAKGNLNARVKGEYKGDHAEIKNALNITGETIQSYIDEISDILDDMASKDLSGRIEREYLGDFIKLKDSINYILIQFNSILSEINASAEQVEASSEQVASSSQNLSQGSSEQAGSVEEISASIMQMAEQTRENAENASKANAISEKAKKDAKNGNVQMEEMLQSMNNIKNSSKNISNIIKVIDEIAFQTNILALNAAVEAARAGEHGKGFAVVAEEVRNLAARSARAAKETTELIDNSINKVNHGYEIANETAKALKQIVTGVTNAVEIVSTIADASNEQANAINEINQGIEQISAVTQSNTATAEQSASAGEEMTEQAQMLKALIQEFRLSGTARQLPDNTKGHKKIPAPEENNNLEISLIGNDFL